MFSNLLWWAIHFTDLCYNASDSPKGTPVLSISHSFSKRTVSVAVEEIVLFNCERDDVRSKPEITNYVFIRGEETEADIEHGTWEANFTSINQSGSWLCQTKNNVGLGEQSEPVEVTVEGTYNLSETTSSLICTIILQSHVYNFFPAKVEKSSATGSIYICVCVCMCVRVCETSNNQYW